MEKKAVNIQIGGILGKSLTSSIEKAKTGFNQLEAEKRKLDRRLGAITEVEKYRKQLEFVDRRLKAGSGDTRTLTKSKEVLTRQLARSEKAAKRYKIGLGNITAEQKRLEGQLKQTNAQMKTQEGAMKNADRQQRKMQMLTGGQGLRGAAMAGLGTGGLMMAADAFGNYLQGARGLTIADKALNAALTGAMGGASAGLMMGGGVGAAVGGIVGAIGSGLSTYLGESSALAESAAQTWDKRVKQARGMGILSAERPEQQGEDWERYQRFLMSVGESTTTGADNAGTALLRMLRRTDLARKKSGEVYKNLREIGFTDKAIEGFGDMDTLDRFEAIMNRIDKAKASRKPSLTFDIFGVRGMENFAWSEVKKEDLISLEDAMKNEARNDALARQENTDAITVLTETIAAWDAQLNADFSKLTKSINDVTKRPTVAESGQQFAGFMDWIKQNPPTSTSDANVSRVQSLLGDPGNTGTKHTMTLVNPTFNVTANNPEELSSEIETSTQLNADQM